MADRHVEAIDALNRANRLERDPMLEAEVRRIRHLAGIALVERPTGDPRFPEPSADIPPIGAGSRLPEITTDHVTPALLRGAILRHGALLVKGLIDGPTAARFADDIERAFELRSTFAPDAADEPATTTSSSQNPRIASSSGSGSRSVEESWRSTLLACCSTCSTRSSPLVCGS